MKLILSIILALLVCNGAEAVELIENGSFDTDFAPWTSVSRDELVHNSQNGHLTPNGSAQVTGHVNGTTGIASSCMDVSHLALSTKFHAEASIKAASAAIESPLGIVDFYQYTGAGCTLEIRINQIVESVEAGVWTRVSGDYFLKAEIKAIRVVLRANRTPDGGTVLFDDATFTVSLRNTELFDNHDLTTGTAPWSLHWGDTLSHNADEGNLTRNGAAQVVGTLAALRGLYQPVWT